MSCRNNGIVETALNSLGKGFDLTSDFRLKYCKGKERLILLNESEKREITIPGFGAFEDVSVDIKCDKGDRTRHQSDILDFIQMAEFFNQKCGVGGKIPSGEFNSMFGFQSGSWGKDAGKIKCLGLDGYFIILFNLHIDRYPLLLSHEVVNDVPSAWDPPALARFIEKYGTHIIVGLSIGGQDVVLVRQHKSSDLQPSHLKKHLDDLGDQLFTGTCSFNPNSKDPKLKVPQAFNIFDQLPLALNSYPSISTKEGISVICSKRGGDTEANSHCEWLPTVAGRADAIHFNFIPITSLLKAVPGKGFLSHAINLYLRYKPPICDLQYFLDFQSHNIWAPIHNDLPLGPSPKRASSSPVLHFNLMGPKLYVNTSQVIVGRRPVTGMRLYLEGMKCNRLAIHLQYLSNLPKTFENKMDDIQYWHASEDRADNVRFFEAIHRKNFSHVCTAPVKYNPKWAAAVKDVVYIVTGAQLHVKKHDSKSVLHLRLVFSKVSDSFIVQSSWAQAESGFSQKSGLLSAISQSLTGSALKEKEEVAVVVDSAVYPTGPPVPVQTPKLLKFVETSQLCRGPEDSPGYWLVTGARLQVEKGKISLHVKFSLINICSAKIL
ncbi:MACPF domain-containing protein [Hibiscus syriacus]|uniref:MACPF domain-containing protein n=1 Tax=Hibiscus syriacus TaxID=106335 RepID=A0A6A3CS84_HIBSY|nr:MACPF domain-containing protein At1g14780-like isoform X1 [Hibiscus syriacus]KAE8730048.1 MACPF domain-containing protein [Hibiscus syriacus]